MTFRGRTRGNGVFRGATLLTLSMAIAMTVCLALLPAYVAASATPSIPAPTSDFYVLDQAGVLSASTSSMIVDTSAALAAASGAQIVVVTVDSIGSGAISDYALAILRGWGVGDKTKNNGLVMVVSVGDRQSWISVGYGLEGRLNDAKVGRIQDTYMVPYFKTGDYDTGIRNGYLALVDEVAAEYNLDPATLGTGNPTPAPSDTGSSGSNLALFIGIGIFFLVDWIFLRGRITSFLLLSMFLRRGGGGGFGGGGGGGGFSGGGGSGGGGGAGRGW